jgi:DNA-binding transcriptional LysR family regulator
MLKLRDEHSAWSRSACALTDQGRDITTGQKPLVGEMDEADSELTSGMLNASGLIRIAVSATFGRRHILPLIPEPLSLNPGLQVDLVLSDFVRDMVEDRIDLAIRVGPVNDLDAVVRRATDFFATALPQRV